LFGGIEVFKRPLTAIGQRGGPIGIESLNAVKAEVELGISTGGLKPLLVGIAA